MDNKTIANPTVLLLNCVNWHVDQSADCADLGDYEGARRHRTIADQLIAQLRDAGDVGRRLAEVMRAERDD